MEHLPYTTTLRTSEQTDSQYILMYVVFIRLYVISCITNRVLKIQIPWCPHPRSISQNTQISIWILHHIYKDHLNKKNLWPTSYPFLHSDINNATTRCQVLSKHRGHRNKHDWATLCKLNLIKKKKRLIVTIIIMRQCNKHSDISIKIWNRSIRGCLHVHRMGEICRGQKLGRSVCHRLPETHTD